MKKTNVLTVLALSSLLLLPNIGQTKAKEEVKKSETTTYNIDTDHSSVEFKISHLIGKVKGTFNKFDGKIDVNPEKWETMKVTGKIETASIDTGIEKRDNHLRSGDFFDVNNPKKPEYKSITFESTKFHDVKTKGNETTGKLDGNITIHGVTKPITLDVTINGKPIEAFGSSHLGISAAGTLNRKDFGLTWNKAIETGGLIVGDEVSLSLEVEAFHKEEPKAEPKKDEKGKKTEDIKNPKKDDKK